jgi:transcriptional regulator with XRE-family HTH domain
MKPDFMQQCYDQFVTPEKQEFIKLNVEIANRIYDILDERGLSQRDFAKLMDKTEAEVSRWLSGTHNFTIATIAAINIKLKEDVLSVPEKQQFIFMPIPSCNSVFIGTRRARNNRYQSIENLEYAYK